MLGCLRDRNIVLTKYLTQFPGENNAMWSPIPLTVRTSQQAERSGSGHLQSEPMDSDSEPKGVREVEGSQSLAADRMGTKEMKHKKIRTKGKRRKMGRKWSLWAVIIRVLCVFNSQLAYLSSFNSQHFPPWIQGTPKSKCAPQVEHLGHYIMTSWLLPLFPMKED